MKKYLFLLSSLMLSNVMMAQSGTNSPYSQYGFGLMSEQSQGFNRGMNGVGLGFREGTQVNYINPASYSSIDSLTFIFDVGMSLQTTNFKENGKSKNASNANFEYAVASFRALPHFGISFGIIPYSNIGYNYSTKTEVPNYIMAPAITSTTTVSNLYEGSGGLRQVYVGLGWEPIKGLSVGGNLNYIWGSLNNYISNTYSDNNVKSLIKKYSTDVSNVKFDFGLQYTYQLKNNRSLTAGVTWTPGRNLGSDAECSVITTNTQSMIADTTRLVSPDAVTIPTQWGFGVAYKDRRWKAGLDYKIQKWESIKYSVYEEKNGKPTYEAVGGLFKDRHSINAGGEYCVNEYGRSFADRIKYRFGAGYSSSYLKINGYDGPKEISISAGVALPIINNWNNRSVLNVSVRWANRSAKHMLTENTFMVNIGLTFNERWFAKWKFE